ncbi:MAG: hypothetical protein MI757_12525, partial [Pirellulales bacterium]|nr:hypothetical protein [Pirellulales bacterium]
MRTSTTLISTSLLSLVLFIGCGGGDEPDVADAGDSSAATGAEDKKPGEASADDGQPKSTDAPADPFATADEPTPADDPGADSKETGDSDVADPFAPPAEDNKVDLDLPFDDGPTPAATKDDPKRPSLDDRFSNPFEDDDPTAEPQIPDILSAPPGKQRIAAQLEQLKNADVKVADVDFRGAQIAPDDLAPVVAATKP